MILDRHSSLLQVLRYYSREEKIIGKNLQINVVLRQIKPSEFFVPLIKHLSWPSDSNKEYIWESKSMVMFHKKKKKGAQMLFKGFVVLYWLC